MGAYVLGSFVYLTTTPNPPTNSFGALLGLFLLCLAIIPFFQAFLRRPHPDSVEVRDDGLVLRFASGQLRRLAWEARPVEFAYDTRTATHGKRPYEGMEVQMYLPTEARDGSTSIRPQEVDVSGAAFDEVKKAMEGAGFRVVSRRWSRGRPGDLVEFLAKGEEEVPLPPEIRGGFGIRAHPVPPPKERSEDT